MPSPTSTGCVSMPPTATPSSPKPDKVRTRPMREAAVRRARPDQRRRAGSEAGQGRAPRCTALGRRHGAGARGRRRARLAVARFSPGRRTPVVASVAPQPAAVVTPAAIPAAVTVPKPVTQAAAFAAEAANTPVQLLPRPEDIAPAAAGAYRQRRQPAPRSWWCWSQRCRQRLP